jgi:hypothetical protein
VYVHPNVKRGGNPVSNADGAANADEARAQALDLSAFCSVRHFGNSSRAVVEQCQSPYHPTTLPLSSDHDVAAQEAV